MSFLETAEQALRGAAAAGESNLKIRRPVDLKGAMPASSAAAAALVGLLQCEPPNARLHSFEGRLSTHTLGAAPRSPQRLYLTLCCRARCERVEFALSSMVSDIPCAVAACSFSAEHDAARAALLREHHLPRARAPGAEARRAPAGGVAAVPVSIDEVLLRGCTLKNSGHVAGLVVYTGAEARIQMNAAAPPRKRGAPPSPWLGSLPGAGASNARAGVVTRPGVEWGQRTAGKPPGPACAPGHGPGRRGTVSELGLGRPRAVPRGGARTF